MKPPVPFLTALLFVGQPFYPLQGLAETGAVSQEVKIDSSKKPGSLPDWYAANRVHFHWENAALLKAEKRTLEQWCAWLKSVHQDLAESGAKVTVTAGRWGAEGAWWPTEVGKSYDSFEGRDILANDIIGDYRARGLKTIIYYRHDIDYAMQQEHPEWLARQADGHQVKKDRGLTVYHERAWQMCQNSPFREFTKQRLVEIFKRGADGVYFDEDHMPSTCFCDNCKKAFQKQFGKPLPENPQEGTAEYLEVAHFVGSTLIQTFQEWLAAVRQVNPSALLVVSAEEYSQFTGCRSMESLPLDGFVYKTEYQKCFGGQQHWPGAPIQILKKEHPEFWLPARDLQESLAWMIARDAHGGRPPHVWVHKPETGGEVVHSMAAVVAHGAVASAALSPVKKALPINRKVFEMNDALAPFMRESRPYGWALIHVSEALKDELYVEGGTDGKAHYQHLFENLYAPVLGAAVTLREAHFPFATLSDTALKQGKFAPETRVLLVPSYQRASKAVKAAIDKVESEGKIKVIKLEGTWHQEAAHPKLKECLLAAVGTPPVYVTGPKNMVATYMVNEKRNSLLVSLVRDWHWFWIGDKKKPGEIWDEERPRQSAIENIKIICPAAQGIETLYPGKEAPEATLDICRFVQIKRGKKDSK